MAVSKMFLFIFLFVSKSINGHYIDSLRDLQPCGEPLLIEKETVIDAQSYENCKLQIQTQPNRILAFSLVHGDLEQAQEFLSVLDGSGKDIFESQIVHEVERKDLPKTFYTTNSVAEIVFKKVSTSSLQIKMQKAVDCPFNIGAESTCARVVDELSCHCYTYTLRNHASQTTFCKNNGMLLWAIENGIEENAVRRIWGTSTQFWTSGTDTASEGTWVWESTGIPFSADYTNWANREPNNANGGEDCMLVGFSSGGWIDATCTNGSNGICELNP